MVLLTLVACGSALIGMYLDQQRSRRRRRKPWRGCPPHRTRGKPDWYGPTIFGADAETRSETFTEKEERRRTIGEEAVPDELR